MGYCTNLPIEWDGIGIGVFWTGSHGTCLATEVYLLQFPFAPQLHRIPWIHADDMTWAVQVLAAASDPAVAAKSQGYATAWSALGQKTINGVWALRPSEDHQHIWSSHAFGLDLVQSVDHPTILAASLSMYWNRVETCWGYPPLVSSALLTHTTFEPGDFIVSFSGCKIYSSQEASCLW